MNEGQGPIARATWLLALIGLVLAGFAIASGLGAVENVEYGMHLVDADGMTVYAFLPDEAGDSTCYGDCADAWPPLLAPEDDLGAALGEGVDADLVGTVERDDGSMQLTYDGWPLYLFAQDAAAGDVAGQGAAERWYVVAPNGDLIGTEADDASTGSGGGDVAALMQEGEVVYGKVCASCHGENGDEELASHVVQIVGNERGVEDEARLVRRILWGGSYMPGLASSLSDREVAAVATFVRNSWGHDYGPVSEEVVAEWR